MYEIIKLNERQLSEFKGKIIQVISSSKQDVVVGRDYLGLAITSCMWTLTCLVEIEECEEQ